MIRFNTDIFKVYINKTAKPFSFIGCAKDDITEDFDKYIATNIFATPGKIQYLRRVLKLGTHMILPCNKEMAFCYQNCSDLLWEKNVLVIAKTFEIRGWWLRICKIFEITRTIYSNSEGSEQFLVTECFFNLFLEVSQI